ncbi:hypothetical protein N7516_004632 [Penicillium verrucosum]|uniref:uncharacterized protein n=1 Tax=Penicillium verrucosum TaxID=60171 RepID=UPI0025454945|nr:uncharacterized protein N7516_004632 [Penicillium verrucosum]KAJ5944464.1 hypothetical protein N7516_004632 [Penicillium verrucosum]
MGTACLWGRTRELELRITAHMDSTRLRKEGNEEKIIIECMNSTSHGPVMASRPLSSTFAKTQSA